MSNLELENHIFDAVLDFATDKIRHAQEVGERGDLEHSACLLMDASNAIKAAHIQISCIRTLRKEESHAPSL